MKVLVPLDGSRLADGILPHVQRVLLREAAELELLRVLPLDADEAVESAARRRLEEAAEGLRAQGEKARTILVKGEPAQEILAWAEKDRPDLIAMATHGRSGLTRLIRGSVAERVLRHSPVPVYLANPKGLAQPGGDVRFERVLVPLDGSDTAASILPLVLPLVRDSGAEVVLLHVDVPEAESTHPVPEVASRRAQKRAEAALADTRARLELSGVTTHVLGAYGDPAVQALETAQRQDVDLLAMSSHGRTGLSRWRFGSVAEKVLRECRCPVLLKVVKQGPAKGASA
jgi:nucleotide-binding universal stress UspA family protein